MSIEVVRTYNALAPAGYHRLHWTAKASLGYGIVGGYALSASSLREWTDRQSGWNFYVSLNPVKDSCRGAKPAKTDIAALACIGMDLDLHGKNCTFERATEVANGLILSVLNVFKRPLDDRFYAIIRSGGGVWLWLFVEPQVLTTQEDRDEADYLIRGVTEVVFDGHPVLRELAVCDMSCAEISRIARCPGTMNYKRGIYADFVDYIQPNCRLSLAEVKKVAMASTAKVARTGSAPAQPITSTSLQQLVPKLNTTSKQFILLGVSKEDESRHRRLFSTAKHLAEIGVPKALALEALMAGATLSRPSLLKDDPHCINNILKQLWGA